MKGFEIWLNIYTNGIPDRKLKKDFISFMFSMSYDRQFEKYDLKPRIFARIMTVTVNLQCYLTIMYLWSHRLCKYPPLQVEGHD